MFDWITNFIGDHGYGAIAALMLAENLFPPIPSELVMPLAGFSSAHGDMLLVVAITAGTAGSLLGAVFWYWIGAKIGGERLKRWSAAHGRWITLSPEDIDRAFAWFEDHGNKTVLLGRLVPGLRTLISLPAGVAGMPFMPFLLYTSLGTAAWTILLACAGYLLEGQYRAVAAWTNPVANVVVGLLVAVYAYRVVTFGRRKRRS